MHSKDQKTKLAQTASSIGAGILGYGLGVWWSEAFKHAVLWILLVGTLIHIWGMYNLSLASKPDSKTGNWILWMAYILAWVCLLVIVIINIYFLMR